MKHNINSLTNNNSAISQNEVAHRHGMSMLRHLLGVVFAALLLATFSEQLFAKENESEGKCTDGSWTVLGLSGKQDRNLPANTLGASFLVRGKYIEFTVDAATLGVRDWTLTGASNALDITGGIRTVVFSSKTPDHRGLVLSSALRLKMDKDSLVLERTGQGLSMKIQAKDCTQGGVFQMEVERGDNSATVFTHVLSDNNFYFDNPNFRDRIAYSVFGRAAERNTGLVRGRECRRHGDGHGAG